MATEFFDAPQLEPISKKVIGAYDELAHCKEAKIKFLFKSSEKSKYLGKCHRATGKWKHLTGYDFVVEIWSEFWNQAATDQKEALLYHELRHIMRVEKMKNDILTINWKLREHDTELFFGEVEHFGAWRDEIATLKTIIGVPSTIKFVKDE
jgi:hypothetical protein